MRAPPQPGDIVRENCGGRHARTARVQSVDGATMILVDIATGAVEADDAEWWHVVVSPIRLR